MSYVSSVLVPRQRGVVEEERAAAYHCPMCCDYPWTMPKMREEKRGWKKCGCETGGDLITSVAQPLLAEWVQGLLPPPQLVHATISFGPPVSRFFSPCKWATYSIFCSNQWRGGVSAAKADIE